MASKTVPTAANPAALVLYPFAVGGAMTFANKDELTKFLLCMVERLSVGMELFVKDFPSVDAALSETMLGSYADMAYQVRQAAEVLHREA